MTIEFVSDILTDVFFTTLIILLPILGASLVVGVLISIFQAVTSIQEMTLTFVPKVIVIIIVFILSLPFIADQLISLTMRYYTIIETAAK